MIPFVRRNFILGLWFMLFLFTAVGCLVEGTCQTNADCAGDEICSMGECTFECKENADCPLSDECIGHQCVAAEGCLGCPAPSGKHATATCEHGVCTIQACEEGYTDEDKNPYNGCEVDEEGNVEQLECPSDMSAIDERYCIDRFEASRPDATADDAGVDETMAMSRNGVLPWQITSMEEAQAACQAAGKRLCAPAEWGMACRGGGNFVYSYGDEYEPTTCNGIDTFCPDPEPGCGGSDFWGFHLMPTGSFDECTNEYGVFDINGNVWEITFTEDGVEHYRGGAFNCQNSALLHQCDYDGNWGPSAKGFRCCK